MLCFGGMLLFRFPNAGALSVLMGVTAIVPVLGPWIGSLTSVLLMLITDPSKALWFALFILMCNNYSNMCNSTPMGN